MWIYKITNIQNNKVYIGQTKQKVEDRWRHGEGYKTCSIFYRAIQKYGWDNFEHIILETNLTLEQANQMEEYYINFYKSTELIYGYNISKGGNNHTLSESTKRKIGEKNSISKLGSSHTEETKKKMSESHKGKLKQPHSIESKRKMSKSHQEYLILCVTTGEIFYTIKEASDAYNVDRANISKCCRGLRKSAGKHPITKEKLQWSYISSIC